MHNQTNKIVPSLIVNSSLYVCFLYHRRNIMKYDLYFFIIVNIKIKMKYFSILKTDYPVYCGIEYEFPSNIFILNFFDYGKGRRDLRTYGIYNRF